MPRDKTHHGHDKIMACGGKKQEIRLVFCGRMGIFAFIHVHTNESTNKPSLC